MTVLWYVSFLPCLHVDDVIGGIPSLHALSFKRIFEILVHYEK